MSMYFVINSRLMVCSVHLAIRKTNVFTREKKEYISEDRINLVEGISIEV